MFPYEPTPQALFESRRAFIGRLLAWLCSVWADPAIGATADVLATEPNVKPDEIDPDARPVCWRWEAERNAVPNMPDLWPTGVIGGGGFQWFHGNARGADFPDRIVAVQDMGAVRCSEDGGLTWYAPTQKGLHAFNGSFAYIDPADANVVFVGLASAWDPVDTAQDGIWRSTDFCRTFSLAKNIPSLCADNTFRYHHKTMARWPLTGGAAANAKYRFVAQIKPARRSASFQASQLYASTGGTAWAFKGSVPQTTTGLIGALVQHPTRENTLYLCTQRGIFETTDWDAATPTFTAKWHGTFGEDSGVTRLWISSAKPEVMIACAGGNARRKMGVWITVDGGGRWTQSLAGWPAANLEVGAARANGTRTVYVHSRGKIRGSTLRPKMRDLNSQGLWGGKWYEPTSVQYSAPNIPSTAAPWRDLSGHSGLKEYGSFCTFLPHPADPDEVLSYSYHYYWRTDDGGRSFKASNSYQDGLNAHQIVFLKDPAKSGEIHMACADYGNVHFTDEARQCTSYNISATQRRKLGVPTRSAVAIIVLPDTTDVPPDKRGRIIMACGKVGGGGVGIFWRNARDTSWSDFIGETAAHGGGAAKRARGAYDWLDPARIYLGSNKSDSYGESWTALERSFLGMSEQDNRIVYGFEGATIYRSSDRGASFLPYYSLNTSLAAGAPQAWLDPHDHDRVYSIESTNGVKDLVLLAGAPGSVTKRSIGLWGVMSARVPQKGFAPNCFAVDPKDPRIIYVGLRVVGESWLFRGDWIPGFTTITWTDITRNLPRVNVRGHIGVNPHTGDLVIGSVNGVFVLPPPGGDKTARSIVGPIYDAMPAPVDNHWRMLVPADRL